MSKKLRLPAILIFCEGASDKKFVNSIKRAYGNNSRFRIEAGSGGSQNQILSKCIKVEGEYEKYCVMDGTPTIEDSTKEKAKENNVTIIEIIPFLECVILNIIENNNSHDTGVNKNTAKDKLKTLAKSKGGLETLFNDTITKTFLIERKTFLANFSTILDLFEKYKQNEQDQVGS